MIKHHALKKAHFSLLALSPHLKALLPEEAKLLLRVTSPLCRQSVRVLDAAREHVTDAHSLDAAAFASTFLLLSDLFFAAPLFPGVRIRFGVITSNWLLAVRAPLEGRMPSLG